jgi:hypothetical protein
MLKVKDTLTHVTGITNSAGASFKLLSQHPVIADVPQDTEQKQQQL